ncbi:acetyltransferase [Niallia taxi]|uniref:Acetyltransferase n=1 Tax=Niallia taxi TaxID=2499688 RepID=A0A437K8F9_9BACI|nr:acetyltransferase [Niallia taxi]MDK8640529.1 acetyltransferase [Niallia taxi]MED4035993.1 acetyltransferase [Niallia taxi]RVT60234.1 acetyltransferase [Niallia taxi]
MTETTCPQCNSDNINKGVIVSGVKELHMYAYENRRRGSSPILSYYCGECGYIIGSFVENPNRLAD